MSLSNELIWFGHRLDTQFNHIRLVYLSDLHYGNPYFAPHHLARTIEYIRINDDVFAILNGDLIEAVVLGSKGDIYSQTVTPQMQKEDMIDMLKPIAPKILGMATGNHEARIYDRCGTDSSRDIAKALNVPYRPEGMYNKIMFGDGNNRHVGKPFVFWSYCTHGYGGARTKAAKAVKVERLSTWAKADVYAMSHDHVVNVAPDVFIEPDERSHVDSKTGFLVGKAKARRKMLIKTNAYLKWGGYAEMGGFPPVDLCTPIVMLLTPKSDYWNMLPEKPSQAVKVIV